MEKIIELETMVQKNRKFSVLKIYNNNNMFSFFFALQQQEILAGWRKPAEINQMQ